MQIEALFIGGVMDGRLMKLPEHYSEYTVPLIEKSTLDYSLSQNLRPFTNVKYQSYIPVNFTVKGNELPSIYALNSLTVGEVFTRIFSVYWRSKKYIDQISKRVDIESINVDNPFADILQAQAEYRDLVPATDNNKP